MGKIESTGTDVGISIVRPRFAVFFDPFTKAFVRHQSWRNASLPYWAVRVGNAEN